MAAPSALATPHQARVETPLPEIHLPGDPHPDILCPIDAQRLCKKNVGEDKRTLGFPSPANNPPPLHCQYFCEAASHCA